MPGLPRGVLPTWGTASIHYYNHIINLFYVKSAEMALACVYHIVVVQSSKNVPHRAASIPGADQRRVVIVRFLESQEIQEGRGDVG